MNLFSKLLGTKTPARPRRQNWLPRLEVLEDRTVPAGNVLSSFSTATGSLELAGDELANVVRITKDPASTNRIRVEALLGTRLDGVINGISTFRLNHFGARLDLEMKAGDDAVTVDVIGLSLGVATRVNLGDGQNSIVVDHLNLRNQLTVLGGDGIDNVFLSDVVSNGLTVRTGRGDDLVLLGNVEVRGHAVFDTGTGADVIANSLKSQKSQGVRIWGELRVDLGAGQQDPAADSIMFVSAPFQVDNKISIHTGGGADVVTLGGLDADHRAALQDLTIDTSAGNDTILLTSLRGRDLQVQAYSGSNIIRVGNFGNPAEPTYQGPVAFTGRAHLSTAFSGNEQIILRQASFGSTFHYEATGAVGVTAPTVSALIVQACYFHGDARFSLGAGRDEVFIQRDSVTPDVGSTIFNGRVTFDLGRGNDEMFIGHYTATSHPVTFRGRVVFNGGLGTNFVRGFSPNLGTITYAGGRSQILCALLDALA